MRETVEAIATGRRVAADVLSSGWLRSGMTAVVSGSGAKTAAEGLRRIIPAINWRTPGSTLAAPGVRYDIGILTDDLTHASIPAASAILQDAATAARTVIAALPQRHNLAVFDPECRSHGIDAADRHDSRAGVLSVWDRDTLAAALAPTRLATGSQVGHRSLIRFDRESRPDVLLWAPGHSVTSQAVRMALSLGWCSPGADAEYGEPVAIRDFNEAVIRSRGETWSDDRASQLLHEFDAGATGPWIIKEPRFCDLWRRWLPIWAPYAPTLVYLVRDPDGIRGSFARRQGVDPSAARCRGRLVTDVIREAEAVFDGWPGRKLRLPVGAIADAVATWDASRLA
jgi:hypothetical protein